MLYIETPGPERMTGDDEAFLVNKDWGDDSPTPRFYDRCLAKTWFVTTPVLSFDWLQA